MTQTCPIDGSDLEQVIIDEWLDGKAVGWQCMVCGGTLLDKDGQRCVVGGVLPVDGELSTLQHPRDGSPMVAFHVGQTTLFGDKNTGEIWFGAGTLVVLRELVRQSQDKDDGPVDQPTPLSGLAPHHGFSPDFKSGELQYKDATVTVEHQDFDHYQGRIQIQLPFEGPVSARFREPSLWGRIRGIFASRPKLPDARLNNHYQVESSTWEPLVGLLSVTGPSHVLVQLGQLGDCTVVIRKDRLSFSLTGREGRTQTFEHLCRLFYDCYANWVGDS